MQTLTWHMHVDAAPAGRNSDTVSHQLQRNNQGGFSTYLVSIKGICS